MTKDPLERFMECENVDDLNDLFFNDEFLKKLYPEKYEKMNDELIKIALKRKSKREKRGGRK